MKLADWLYENSVSPQQIRRMLGGISRRTFHRYLTGERVPKPTTLQQIIEITDGEVLLIDFLDTDQPECAIPIREEGETRFILPWSPEFEQIRDRPDLWDHPLYSPPVQRAIEILGGRVKPHRNGTVILDGRLADFRMIVEEANRLLLEIGEAQIAYPGVQEPTE